MKHKDLFQRFAQADPTYGPVPFWWWSAEEVTAERIRWQLKKFRDGGLRNIGIINLAPTGPQYGSVADRPVFASEEWWRMFEVALKEAEKLGMRLWFYDQIGFSGSNMPARIVTEFPQFAGYQLRRFAHGEQLPRHIEPLYKDGEHIYAAVRQGFNWLDSAATCILINRIHGEMERRFPYDLGKTLAGSFQDELPPLALWTPALSDFYMGRFGEALTPLLPALFDPIPGHAQVRRRVYRLAAELAEQSFFIPVGEWHRKHDMLIGCDQAGPARRADPNGAQRLYLDYFRTHRHYNSAGSDMDGEIKPHSSMMHLHGGSRVWLEGFHSSGWGGSLEETMHWLIPWFQAGATLYSPHAVYYSTRGGWWEWAPPDTGWRQPYFEHYPVFADTVSRVCYLLSAGAHVCDVAVYYPSYAVCGHLSLDDADIKEHPMAVANRDPNEQVTHIHNVYKSVAGSWNRRDYRQPGALREAKLDYDIVDDSALHKSVPTEHGLQIADERFSALLLCGTTLMDDEARNKVEAWIAQGGLVVAVDVPETERNLPGALYAEMAAEAVAIIEPHLPKRVVGPGASLHRRTDDADIFLLQPPEGALLRMHEPSQPNWALTDKAVYRLRTDREPKLWDPVSGRVRKLAWTRQGEMVEVTVPFDSWPAALVVCTDAGISLPTEDDQAAAHEALRRSGTVFAAQADHCVGGDIIAELPNDRWRVLAVPTLDNRYGDFDLHGDDNDFLPIERRMMQVRTETSVREGEAAGWHRPEMVDSDWTMRLWSEAEYWRICHGDSYVEHKSHPAVYSNVFGDMAMRSWAGRMGRVPRRYLNLGRIEKGQNVWVRTNVIAPAAGRYWIRTESNATIRGTVNGKEIAFEGGPEELTAWIELTEGANDLLLRAEAIVSGLIRAGVEIVHSARPALPKWIFSKHPTLQSAFSKRIFCDRAHPFRRVRIVFAGKGRAAMYVNGVQVTEHGDFNPYIRQGQEEVDVTELWSTGFNEVKFVLPEGEGEVFADGLIELQDGTELSFCTGSEWLDEQGRQPGILHSAVLQFAETESLWITARPHLLPEVSWLMPDHVPDPKPLPFAADPAAIGCPVWLRFPLPVGVVAMKIPAKGRMRVWIDGEEASVTVGRIQLPIRQAGTIAAIRIEPSGTLTEASVLTGPIRFETAPAPGSLGDWRTVLCLPHHSGAVEYETEFETAVELTGAMLELGHVRGTAEAWLDGVPLGVRIWKPYRYALGSNVSAGKHRLRIRVTNTLGTHYEYGRPTSLVGGNPDVAYWNREHPSEEEGRQMWFPSCGMHGPVRIVGGQQGNLGEST